MCRTSYATLQAEAESACEIEGGKNSGLTGPQCQRLEQFENFVRQMVGEGHVVNFITTLQSLSHADQRRLAKELEGMQKQKQKSPFTFKFWVSLAAGVCLTGLQPVGYVVCSSTLLIPAVFLMLLVDRSVFD